MDCNSNTGSWYVRAYEEFVNILGSILSAHPKEPNSFYTFNIQKIYPLRIFKAIMTMFCDINNGCLGDEQLRNSLLDKKANKFNTDKYSVYMYLTKGPLIRIQGLSAMHISNIGITMQSEISHYPIGLVLYIDKPPTLTPIGIDITRLSSFEYDQCVDVKFNHVPFLEVNTYIPCDYSSKEDVICEREGCGNLKL